MLFRSLFLSPVVCVCITFGDLVARPAGLFAYVLMPIACNTLVALHFRQAMLVSGASLLVFVVYLGMLPEVAIDVKLQAWLVCAAATTMTAWANWRTDRGDRIAFLWLTRERLVAEMTQRRAEELHEMSKIDPLTGIANRRVFEERLGAHARGETLALIMVDIDHFKLFNDHYGHLAGDQCLQRVARALAEGVRTPDDLVARLGGEEFVILMPGLGAEGIMPVLDRLRRTVERLAIPHAGVRGDATDVVTISLGCAVAQPESSEECRALLTRADRALYRAKNEGRNRWRLTA